MLQPLTAAIGIMYLSGFPPTSSSSSPLEPLALPPTTHSLPCDHVPVGPLRTMCTPHSPRAHSPLQISHFYPISSCSAELLAELLSSADLFVMQVEMDAYTLAKKVGNRHQYVYITCQCPCHVPQCIPMSHAIVSYVTCQCVLSVPCHICSGCFWPVTLVGLGTW